MFGVRSCWSSLALLWVTLLASTARAASPDECIAAHAEGQRLRREGQLLTARDRLLACSDESCPAIIRKDCSAFHDQVEAQIPTVVSSLLDPQGNEVRDGAVSIDDASNRSALDGRAVALDPGAHRFTFTAPGGERTTTSVTIREGEKYRRVVGKLPRGGTEPSLIPAPVLAYVLGGVGIAGLGSFTYFALSGKAKEADLEGRCAPRCAQAEVDAMRTRYLIGDVSLAVSLASLGFGTYVFFADPFGERRGHDARDKHSAVKLRFGAAGGPGGAGASVAGRF